jgi:heme exporter protein C
VIGKGGGGLKHPDMLHALTFGFATMTLFAIVLLILRARLASTQARLARIEEAAVARGALEA